MNTPLVSILIPAYNAEKYIARTIRSALAQTYPNIEIVVVDDGSTDGTFEAARDALRETGHSNTRLYSQPNKGAAAARNLAVKLSMGEYLQYLDADDLLSADKIERQVERFTSDDELACCEWTRFFHRVPDSVKVLGAQQTPVSFMLGKFEHNEFMQTACWLVPRRLHERAGGWDERLSYDDDGEYFARLQRYASVIRWAPGGCVYYRDVGSRSLSQGRSRKKLESQFRAMQAQIKYLLDLEDSEISYAAIRAYLLRYAGDFAEHGDLLEMIIGMLREFDGPAVVPLTRRNGVITHLRHLKNHSLRGWDRLLYNLNPTSP